MGKHNRTRQALKNLKQHKAFADGCLKNFEDFKKAKIRRERLLGEIKRNGGGNAPLYKAYASCKNGKRCNVAGCHVCDRINRRADAELYTNKLRAMRHQGAFLMGVVIVPRGASLTEQGLLNFNWDKAYARWRRAYSRYLGKYQTFAWLSADIKWDLVGGYQVHLQGVIAAWGWGRTKGDWERMAGVFRKALKDGLSGKTAKGHKPVQISRLYNLATWTTYCMKSVFKINKSYNIPSGQAAHVDMVIRTSLSNMSRRRRYLEIRTDGGEYGPYICHRKERIRIY